MDMNQQELMVRTSLRFYSVAKKKMPTADTWFSFSAFVLYSSYLLISSAACKDVQQATFAHLCIDVCITSGMIALHYSMFYELCGIWYCKELSVWMSNACDLFRILMLICSVWKGHQSRRKGLQCLHNNAIRVMLCALGNLVCDNWWRNEVK